MVAPPNARECSQALVPLFFAVLVNIMPASGNPPGVVDMPTVQELPVIEALPDPFLNKDGTRVETKEDWSKRREEIKAMLLYYEYGQMPPAPENLTVKEVSSEAVYDGLATEKRLLLTMGPEKKVS